MTIAEYDAAFEAWIGTPGKETFDEYLAARPCLSLPTGGGAIAIGEGGFEPGRLIPVRDVYDFAVLNGVRYTRWEATQLKLAKFGYGAFTEQIGLMGALGGLIGKAFDP